ncbi:MAG: hypothetical protein ACLU0O_08725 [Collinsella sp.]
MDCRGSYDLVRENDFGTLEAGKLADICVLDRDVFAVDPKDAEHRSRSR